MTRALPVRMTSRQARKLRRLGARSPSRRVSQRATALVMLSAGRSATEVARALSTSANTVTNWKKRWIRYGTAGLPDAPRSGRPVLATRGYQRAMLRAVARDPRDLGLDFDRWSAWRLSEYLSEKTGVRQSARWLRHLLAREGARRRPAGSRRNPPRRIRRPSRRSPRGGRVRNRRS